MSKINEDFNNIGSYLKEKLHLNNFPYRMECYDISHIQGTNTVASMVTFINGLSKNLHIENSKSNQQKANLMTFVNERSFDKKTFKTW